MSRIDNAYKSIQEAARILGDVKPVSLHPDEEDSTNYVSVILNAKSAVDGAKAQLETYLKETEANEIVTIPKSEYEQLKRNQMRGGRRYA